MRVCSFTDLVLECLPLLEFPCCCSFAKVETNLKIKVVFITLTVWNLPWINTSCMFFLAVFFLQMECVSILLAYYLQLYKVRTILVLAGYICSQMSSHKFQ